MLMLCDPKKETVTPLVKAEGTNSSLSLIHFYEYFHHCIYIITSIVYYIIIYNQYQGRQDPCHFPTRALWNSAIDNFFRPAAGEPDLANGGGEHPAISWLYDGICYKMHMYMYMYMYVYIYIYICVCVCVCMIMYVYISTYVSNKQP